MAYSITTLLNDISGVVHGTTTNKIPNIYGAINRAARAVLLDVDPKETQRIVQLPQVFNDVFDYPCPVDLKGDRIIDLRPQAGRQANQMFVQDYAAVFDRFKEAGINNAIYTQWNTGLKTLRIEASELTGPETLCDTSTLTGWTATPGASTLGLDQTNNVAGGGAITLNLDAGSPSGVIENGSLNTLDLSSYENVSTFFMWVYMPTGADISFVNLVWGNDSSNKWTVTAYQTQQGTAFQDGWNLLSFTWLGAAVTGSPDASTISYTSVEFGYDQTLQTGVKVCNITTALGYYMEMQYYSKYLFRDPNTNVFQETVDDQDGDKVINLDTESYNLLFNKVAYFVAQQLQGADAQYDADYWQTEYDKALKRYQALNPAEAIVKTESYYTMPQNGYAKYRPGFWRW